MTSPSILAVAEPAAGPTSTGIGAVVVTVAAAALLIWMGWLVLNARRRQPRAPEATPKNLQPYLSDDELESTKLTRVLGAAVITAAVLAFAMGIYYIGESDRQADAAEGFEELNVEEGHRFYETFFCVDCHGPDGGGGGATFVENRSAITTQWAAPSINDVFFRYTEDEVRFWVVNGRSGTPMPAAGLEGGGAMTKQEVEQTLAFLRSIQISQAAALNKIENAVGQALSRIDGGAASVSNLLRAKQKEIEEINAAADKFEQVGNLPTLLRATLRGDNTCTDESAELVETTCGTPGFDGDRDGLSDNAEAEINRVATSALDVLLLLNQQTLLGQPNAAFRFELLPDNGFSEVDAAGAPIADLQKVDEFLRELDNEILTLTVMADPAANARFLTTAETGERFLEDALAAEAWNVDFAAVADATFDGDVEAAMRGAGLYNAYCARCHTAGYSAGVAFEQGPGTGAWAPAINDNRSVVQFPSFDDHVAFVIRGSELAKTYGVNGLGRGWMPGFGQVLSQADIEAIVAYERSL